MGLCPKPRWGRAPRPHYDEQMGADVTVGTLFRYWSGITPQHASISKVLIKLFQKFAGSRGGAPVAIRRVRPPLIVRRTAGVNHKNAPGERFYERGAL